MRDTRPVPVPPAERAVRTMLAQLGEPLTVSDLARSAYLSRFHFSRTFHRATGVTPGRFLSALRLAEAGRLLVTTDDGVADVAVRVGYGSPGTFSTRFTSSVGLSPAEFRRRGGLAPTLPVDRPPHLHGGPDTRATVRGRVHGAGRTPVFVGAFTGAVPQGRPLACTMLDGDGPFVLRVPPGRWHLAVRACDGPPDGPGVGSAPGWRGTVECPPNGRGTARAVVLGPPRALDPPMLLALPDPDAVLGPGVRDQAAATA